MVQPERFDQYARLQTWQTLETLRGLSRPSKFEDGAHIWEVARAVASELDHLTRLAQDGHTGDDFTDRLRLTRDLAHTIVQYLFDSGESENFEEELRGYD